MTDDEVREQVARLEGLLETIQDQPAAIEAVAAVTELYAEALARALRGGDPPRDELVSHLLLLHGLHPVPLEERVRAALEKIRSPLGSRGGAVELLGIEGGVARVRIFHEARSCSGSAPALRSMVEDALLEAAPDLFRVEVEPGAEPMPRLVEVGRFGGGKP